MGLDTSSPVLYVEFPSGRLKIPGTLCFPGAKHVVLKVGTKNAICEDVLDSIVAFGRPYWVGTKEDNPTEAELPLPASIVVADATRGDPRESLVFPPPRAPKPRGTPTKGDKEAAKEAAKEADEGAEKNGDEESGDRTGTGPEAANDGEDKPDAAEEADEGARPSSAASAGEKRKLADEADEEAARARPRAKVETAA